MRNIQIKAEKSGELRLIDPFHGNEFEITGIDENAWSVENGVLNIMTRPGDKIVLNRR